LLYVLSFSEALAEELRGTGVTVTALCPGPTDTDFACRAAMLDTSIFTGRLMTARDVAAIGYRAVARGKTIAIAGLANRALVLVIRFSPKALVTRIAKRMLSRQGHAPTARVLATDSHGSARIRTRSQ
jgi:short-subunit dehydrogenase